MGEAWHQAGMLEKKQNVFDDFTAAAEWLVKSGYTSRDRLAIQGGSNGGLLVGAALTQHPELFGAVVCQVPVADMLRYHLFTRRPLLDPGVRIGRRPEAVPVPLQVLAVPQRQGRDGLPADARHHRGHGRSRRAGPGQEVRGAHPGGDGRGRADPHSSRDEGGARRGKPISKQIDEDRGYLRVPVQGPQGRVGSGK